MYILPEEEVGGEGFWCGLFGIGVRLS